MEYLTLSENILDSLMEEFPAIRTLIEHTGDYNDAASVINDILRHHFQIEALEKEHLE
jgi:hypothetical protein|tara:strand:+ start:806 stop:979 length:174 start_codon:yes stop_codon:yes gene_type:complete